MKTAYCMLNLTYCGVIKFTDELLKRVDELKAIVAESAKSLKENLPWNENISVEIYYGGMKWAKGSDGIERLTISSDGPVLVYSHHNYPDRRYVDEHVRIVIGSDDAYVESDYEEGSENPLSHDGINFSKEHTLGSIPEVYFSGSFLREWCKYLEKHHLLRNHEIINVVEDMPTDHKELLKKAAAAYLQEYGGMLKKEKETEQSIIRESCRGIVNQVLTKLPKGEKLRIGLDFHGVIDDDSQFFSSLSKKILHYEGGEVHILTGREDTPELRDKLAQFGIVYSHLFSITSYHKEHGTHTWQNDQGPWMDPEVWNKSKAVYCHEHGIHLHIDDSDTYGKYFGPGTLYVKYPEMESKRK